MNGDKKSNNSSLCLVCGDDDYLVGNKAKELLDSIVPPDEQMTGVEIVDGNASNASEVEQCVSEIKSALSTGGLFSERKCVWARGVTFVSSGRVAQSSAAKGAVDGLVAFLKEGLAPDSYLIVSSGKPDKRGAFYKLFKSAGDVFEFGTVKQYEQEKNAAAFVGAKLRESGLKMDPNVSRAFLEKVGTSSRLLVSELEKLSLYAGDRRQVEMEDVEKVTSASRAAVAWDLADAFGEKDLVKTLKVLRRLLHQNENEIGMIIGIQGRLRELMVYREALDKGWISRGSRWLEWGSVPSDAEEFFSSGGMRDPRSTHPYRVNVLATQAGKFSLRELRAMFRLSVAAQQRLVSSGESKRSILETLVVRLLRKRRHAKR